tara:strand:- start:250 stop:903 length:654 start_codon:yes stop_codon:yes gene_type:complete
MTTAKKVDSASWERLTDYVYKLEHRLAALEGGGRRQAYLPSADTFRFAVVSGPDIDAGDFGEVTEGLVADRVRDGDKLSARYRTESQAKEPGEWKVFNALPMPYPTGANCLKVTDSAGQSHIFPYPMLMVRVELSEDLYPGGYADAKILTAGKGSDFSREHINVKDYMLTWKSDNTGAGDRELSKASKGRKGLAAYLPFDEQWFLIACQCEESRRPA